MSSPHCRRLRRFRSPALLTRFPATSKMSVNDRRFIFHSVAKESERADGAANIPAISMPTAMATFAARCG